MNDREPTIHEWAWICRRLGTPALLDGRTDRAIRVQRWRAELLRRGWAFADTAAGKRADGSLESWAALFLRVTGESLRDAPAPTQQSDLAPANPQPERKRRRTLTGKECRHIVEAMTAPNRKRGTPTELAELYGITRERVYQVCRNAARAGQDVPRESFDSANGSAA